MSLKVAILDADADPTKAYAEALWHENPKISPSSWRLCLGLTMGKVAFDARQTASGYAAALKTGSNAVLATALTLPRVLEEIEEAGIPREAVVLMVEQSAPEPLPVPVEGVWLRVQGGDDEVALEKLEQMVKDGLTAFYGVCGAVDDLAAWLEKADTAAANVWGRRKRSSLRGVMVPLNPLAQRALRVSTTCHGEESVSVVELAARRGMLVMASQPHRLPTPMGTVDIGLSLQEADAAAAAALTRVAETEQRLRTENVWPVQDGRPLFGVIPALSRGQSPWPTRGLWQAWQAEVWPQLEAHWQAQDKEYAAAWQALVRYGEALATAAESHLAAVLRQEMAQRLPQEWQVTGPLAQAWGVATSLPGVAVCVGDFTAYGACTDLRQALELPDIVNIGKVLEDA